MREFIVEADGGSRGNPGPAGYGSVVIDAGTGETLVERAEYIGVATNNVAEYRGLLAGLRAARELDPSAAVRVRMDSKLVVEQMSGRWKIKHPDMKPLAAEAARILPRAQVTYEWIPREQNKHADRLANEAMDAGKRGEQWDADASRAALHPRPSAPAAPEPSAPPGDATAGAARAREALAAARPAAAGSARGARAAAAVTAAGSASAAGSTTAAAAATAAGSARAVGPTTAGAATTAAGSGTAAGSATGDTASGSAVGAGSTTAAGPARAAGSAAGDTAGGSAVGGDSATGGDSAAGGDSARAVKSATAVMSSGRGADSAAGGPADGSATGGTASDADASGTGGGSPIGGTGPAGDAKGGDAAGGGAEGGDAAGGDVAGAGAAGVGAAGRGAKGEADRRAARAVGGSASSSPSVGWGAAPDLGAPATFVLLRHGETPLTPQKRFSGSGGTDPSLSDVGREQAERVAAALARRGTVQHILASPLARTRQTAGAVAARLGLEVTVDEGLIETDFGAWEGLTFGEVRERHPEDLNAWLADPEAEPTGGGESFAATATRIAATRDRLVAEYAGRTVLLVTHVTPIKTFVRLALGAPPESLFRMELSAASLSAVAYYADGNASVRLFNETSHLRP
ncbi:bifunctional RNase H/acid phosphatase [Streptomyces sp. NPDC020951]|uniref:bifunctional RNase H/acid phosphatase n=1 Tax=Streptomyces sp. NPDC020951 TaxID=3365104 RepID=UPI0037A61E2D